jgi:hypothetical protein
MHKGDKRSRLLGTWMRIATANRWLDDRRRVAMVFGVGMDGHFPAPSKDLHVEQKPLHPGG